MARPARHRPSSIDRLDPQIKAMIGELRIEHGWTIDEIRAKLLELGQPVSRSALGRHTKSLEEIGRELRHSREVAQALVQQLGDAPEDKTAQLNIELTHAMVLRMLTVSEDGAPVSFSPEEAMFISRTLSGLASARKSDAEWKAKTEHAAYERGKRAAEREVLEKVAAKVGTAGSGISAETVEFIRKAVLGAAE